MSGTAAYFDADWADEDLSAQVARELESFQVQLRGRAPVPGTSLERAFRLIEAAGGIRVAGLPFGADLLSRLADAFTECRRYHELQAHGSGDWQHIWIQHCDERRARIHAFRVFGSRTPRPGSYCLGPH